MKHRAVWDLFSTVLWSVQYCVVICSVLWCDLFSTVLWSVQYCVVICSVLCCDLFSTVLCSPNSSNWERLLKRHVADRMSKTRCIFAGCWRWLRVLCQATAGHFVLSPQLLWGVRQCRRHDVRRWNTHVLFSGQYSLFVVWCRKTVMCSFQVIRHCLLHGIGKEQKWNILTERPPSFQTFFHSSEKHVNFISLLLHCSVNFVSCSAVCNPFGCGLDVCLQSVVQILTCCLVDWYYFFSIWFINHCLLLLLGRFPLTRFWLFHINCNACISEKYNLTYL